MKNDTANIGNSDEVKKTATILSNLAQKFRIFIASSMQLLESSTLPVNLTINDIDLIIYNIETNLLFNRDEK